MDVTGPSFIVVSDVHDDGDYFTHLERATKLFHEFCVERCCFIGEGIFSFIYPLSDFWFPGAVAEIIFLLVLEGAREINFYEIEDFLEVLAGDFWWRRWGIRGDARICRCDDLPSEI